MKRSLEGPSTVSVVKIGLSVNLGYLAGHLVGCKAWDPAINFSVGATFNSVRNSLSQEAYLDVSSTTQGRRWRKESTDASVCCNLE